MEPTTIDTYQQTRYNYKNVSAAMPVTIYETAIRCAELQGYETVSAFVRDAVLDKVKATAAAMSAIANEHYTIVWFVIERGRLTTCHIWDCRNYF